MSELKAGVLVTPHDEGMSFHKGSDVIPVTENETEFYLKSEADKELVKLKREIDELEEENKRLKATPEQIMKEVFDKCLIYPKDMVRLDDAYKLAVSLRKQKYKRCLAMARYCDASMAYFGEFYDDASKRMVDHYYKWHKRWLELAEKFKEVK